MTPSTSLAMPTQLVGMDLLNSITTFVAERTTMKGDMLADTGAPETGIKIDGKFEGSIIIPDGGVVHIGPNGRVVGARIEADMIFVEGFADSTIVARKGIEVTGSAHVRGKVEYQEMINMHNLAKVRASVSYTGGDEE